MRSFTPSGLFERSHMQYEVDRAEDAAGEPSIAEMTEKAIKILSKNPKGYFLMVEGNLIEIGNLVSIDLLILHFRFCVCLIDCF